MPTAFAALKEGRQNQMPSEHLEPLCRLAEHLNGKFNQTCCPPPLPLPSRIVVERQAAFRGALSISSQKASGPTFPDGRKQPHIKYSKNFFSLVHPCVTGDSRAEIAEGFAFKGFPVPIDERFLSSFSAFFWRCIKQSCFNNTRDWDDGAPGWSMYLKKN